MKDTKKLNEACLKMFKFLQLLYEDKAEYSAVVNILKDETEEQSVNNLQVNLNKYINTLKVFGIKIIKKQNKFKLLNSLYSLNYTLDDLKSISLLLSSIQNFPDKDLIFEINKFVDLLKLRMNNNDKNTLEILSNSQNYDFSFYYSSFKNQIEQCEEFCKNNYIADITYIKSDKEIRCKCSPREVIYDSKSAYLRVHDSNQRQNLEIPIKNIISITKLPQISNNIVLNTTVVYKLKNRLAKTYKVKENEYVDSYDSQGNMVVINKNESFDKLISRLMRYSHNCEIISPKYVREIMYKSINDTLDNYV